MFSIGGDALVIKWLEAEYHRIMKDPMSSATNASIGSIAGEIQLMTLLVDLIQKVSKVSNRTGLVYIYI